MEAGDFESALTHYEAVIDGGSRDPEVYFRAARSAQFLGAFGLAERYFSLSLRYGGGPEVARSLAKFYLQTSNYMAAVRVFQHLVRIDEDPQPMYSNIGTALMYAGHYLDAETYLLLAQEMNPTDPVPYVNLGILYDRHIRNAPRAVRFYECFLEMASEGDDTRRVVGNRLREIRRQRTVPTDRVGLECGEVFRIPEAEYIDLRQIFDLEFGDQEDTEEIVIDRSRPGEGGEDPVEEGQAPSELRERAREAAASGHYDRAAGYWEAIPEERRDRGDREGLARAWSQIGRMEAAVGEWEALMEEGPTPEVAKELLGLYDRLGEPERAQRICERFAGWPDYEDALAECEE